MSVGKDGMPRRRLSALTNVVIVMIIQLKEPPRWLQWGKETFPCTLRLVWRLRTVYSGTRDDSRLSGDELYGCPSATDKWSDAAEGDELFLIRRRWKQRWVFLWLRLRGQKHLMASGSITTSAAVTAKQFNTLMLKLILHESKTLGLILKEMKCYISIYIFRKAQSGIVRDCATICVSISSWIKRTKMLCIPNFYYRKIAHFLIYNPKFTRKLLKMCIVKSIYLHYHYPAC